MKKLLVAVAVVAVVVVVAWGVWELLSARFVTHVASTCSHGSCTVTITEAGGVYDYSPKERFHTSPDGRFRWRLVNRTGAPVTVQFGNFQLLNNFGGKTQKCPGTVEEGDEPKPCEFRQQQIDPTKFKGIAIFANTAESGDTFKFDLAVGKTGAASLQVFDPELEIDR